METRNIIFVENEFAVSEVLCNGLTSQGYEVTFSSWGKEALKIIKACPDKYNLLITDLNLSDIKGFELAGLMKESCPGINVLLTTGDMSIDENKIKETTCIDEVLFKPFSFDEFFNAVKKLVDNSKQ